MVIIVLEYDIICDNFHVKTVVSDGMPFYMKPIFSDGEVADYKITSSSVIDLLTNGHRANSPDFTIESENTAVTTDESCKRHLPSPIDSVSMQSDYGSIGPTVHSPAQEIASEDCDKTGPNPFASQTGDISTKQTFNDETVTEPVDTYSLTFPNWLEENPVLALSLTEKQDDELPTWLKKLRDADVSDIYSILKCRFRNTEPRQDVGERRRARLLPHADKKMIRQEISQFESGGLLPSNHKSKSPAICVSNNVVRPLRNMEVINETASKFSSPKTRNLVDSIAQTKCDSPRYDRRINNVVRSDTNVVKGFQTTCNGEKRASFRERNDPLQTVPKVSLHRKQDENARRSSIGDLPVTSERRIWKCESFTRSNTDIPTPRLDYRDWFQNLFSE